MYYGGASTSSKKRTLPAKSGCHGVPMAWHSSHRQPPTMGAVTDPPPKDLM